LAFLVSFRDGVTPQQGLDAVLSGFPGTGPFAFSRSERGDVLALDSMVALPWILVVVLGVLTIASLIQWTVSTSRRERHRAAVLRALGLTGGQVTLAFVAAAALVVGTSTVLGLTCGVAAANAAWDVIARWLIVVPHAEIPWLVCSAVITATLLVAVAFAAWSSRRHAGSPALQLRVE
jgi:predicted lysophospholipase L1 biosynthesis ABC-type transport system permease subunit